MQNGEDNCGYYTVSKNQIQDLLDICKEVQQSLADKTPVVSKEDTPYPLKVYLKEDTEVARDLLPTQDGFFFGSTDYDEFYYESLVFTIGKLEEILQNFDFDNNYLVYTSSW